MTAEELRGLVAQYTFQLRVEADDVAREADYQNAAPLRQAEKMRAEADSAYKFLLDFVRWADQRLP